MIRLISKRSAMLGFCLFLLPAAVRSQVVNESVIKSGKTERSGFVALSGYGKAEVSDILSEQFSAEGLKKHGKKKKFIDYKGVVWHVTGANRVDLYYKVTGNKKRSKVYFIASKGYDNYITSVTDMPDAATITTFLGGLDAAIARKAEMAKKQEELDELNKKLATEKADVQKTENAKNQKVMEVKKIQKAEAY